MRSPEGASYRSVESLWKLIFVSVLLGPLGETVDRIEVDLATPSEAACKEAIAVLTTVDSGSYDGYISQASATCTAIAASDQTASISGPVPEDSNSFLTSSIPLPPHRPANLTRGSASSGKAGGPAAQRKVTREGAKLVRRPEKKAPSGTPVRIDQTPTGIY